MNDTPRERTLAIARRFAAALVAGDYATAHACLTDETRRERSPESLEADYIAMTDYGDGPAELDGFSEYMDDWPDKHPDDLGWAYISISGDGYCEAVTVVVSETNGTPRIRSIEWGRP